MTARPQTFFTLKDVSAQDFIKTYAEHLKKNNKLERPKWLTFVKTSVASELSPLDEDWIYVRVAALARKIYLRGHLGVGALRHIYGGSQRNGTTRPRHRACGGKIIRWSLQQLEKLEILQKDKKLKEKRGSRVISKKGQTDLNRIATEIVVNRSKSLAK